MKNEIILFEDQDIKLEVNMKDETVWLTQEQMAKLFEIDRTGISRHIKSIYKEQELEKYSTCANFAHMGNDGKQQYETEYYNLDVIISVGYRIKSKRGIVFRKWANKVLKDYLIKGYAVNNKRLEYLEKTVKLVDIASRIEQEITSDEAKEIIRVISNYSSALNLLDDYDHKKVSKPNGTINNNIITYEDCMKVIRDLKFNNESSLFALKRNDGLKSIIGAIYQTFDEKMYI